MKRPSKLGLRTLASQRDVWLLTASLLAALTFPSWAEDDPAPNTLPPELLTGPVEGTMPPDMAPQSRADLERTRSEAYGQSLTAAQHEQIDSWRPSSVAWWRDQNRMHRAHVLRADLADLLAGISGTLNADTARAAFQAHPDTFGARITPIVEDGGFGGQDDIVPAMGFKVEIDAMTRPDFFALDATIADMASWILDLRTSDPSSADALFYTMFPSLAASDDVGHAELIDQLWDLTEHYTLDRGVAVTSAEAESIEAALHQHRIREGRFLNINSFQAMNRALTEAGASVSRDHFEQYLHDLDQLSEGLSKELLHYAVQTLLPQFSTHLTFLSTEGIQGTIHAMKQGWTNP